MQKSGSKVSEYDYIIAGGGMAGLSLAYRLATSNRFDRTVVVIDSDEKKDNDHTWCFWETDDSIFESIVHRSWDKLVFKGTGEFEKTFDISPYRYKMIRSSEFYPFCKAAINDNPRIDLVQAEVQSIDEGAVSTSTGTFLAKQLVFDSISLPTYDHSSDRNLLQHFLGYNVRVKTGSFDPESFTMFDFNIRQHGQCRFVYVLPTSDCEALIEFTVFSGGLLTDSEYRQELERYIIENFGDFEVLHEEKGVIPMSDYQHDHRSGRQTLRIGTAGGYVKPSTGYSFARTQRRLDKLVSRIEEGCEQNVQMRLPGFDDSWKALMDSVLLDVLEKNRHSLADVFSLMFKRNGAKKMLRFLDEDTSLTEDLEIMRTVPLKPFSSAAASVMFKKLLP